MHLRSEVTTHTDRCVVLLILLTPLVCSRQKVVRGFVCVTEHRRDAVLLILHVLVVVKIWLVQNF